MPPTGVLLHLLFSMVTPYAHLPRSKAHGMLWNLPLSKYAQAHTVHKNKMA